MVKKELAIGIATLLPACGYVPPPTLDASIAEISDPREAHLWIEELLKYRKDNQNYGVKEFYAPCRLTYESGFGDCDDQSICAAALLQGDVDEGYIISLKRSESGHATFLYRVGYFWGVISNNDSEFRAPYYNSLQEAVLKVYGEKYDRYLVRDYTGVDLVEGNETLKDKMTIILTDIPLR